MKIIMKIGILAQKKEKYLDGINRTTIGIMNTLLGLDKQNEYTFIGKTDWLNIPINYFDIIVDSRKVMDLNYVAQFGKYDIIHSHHRPFMFNDKIQCKKILTIHDLIVLACDKSKSGPYHYINTELRKCTPNMDMIITVSKHTKKDVIDYFGIDEKKIKVIYNGLYEKQIIDEEFIRKNILKLNQTPYILAVSTMREYKNIDGLVKAFCIFKERHQKSDLKLVLTGKNDQSTVVGENIKDCLEKQKDIIFTGFVTDNELNWLYKNCLASAFVSFYEGFGLPVLESLSFGKTVICSDKTSLPEVGGEAVEYCNPYDLESIAYAIENVVLNDLRREELEEKTWGQAAKFSYERAAQEILEVYNMLQ